MATGRFTKISIGDRFGKLTAIERLPNAPNGCSKWVCLCDCGNKKSVPSNNLGISTNSCGCLSKVVNNRGRFTNSHGHYTNGKASPTYKVWQSMVGRCYHKTNKSYKYYGMKGVIVCDAWRHSFRQFLSDMGTRPINMTLDRANPFGNYEATNCRWADSATQYSNTKKRYLII
jgi:hypothetical protein